MSKRATLMAFLPAIVLGAFYVTGLAMASTPAQISAQTFDHSQCQYPDRTTNPVDGCDNSDPCDPANVKGGSGDCSDVVTPQPVIEPVAPVTQAPEPAVSCGK